MYRGLNEIITETPPSETAPPTRQYAERLAAERHASEKQALEKQALEKQVAEKQPAEKQQMALNPKHTITYNGVVKILKDSYNFNENVTSTSLDI